MQRPDRLKIVLDAVDAALDDQTSDAREFARMVIEKRFVKIMDRLDTMGILEPCLSCGSADVQLVTKLPGQRKHVYSCESCGLRWSRPFED